MVQLLRGVGRFLAALILMNEENLVWLGFIKALRLTLALGLLFDGDPVFEVVARAGNFFGWNWFRGLKDLLLSSGRSGVDLAEAWILA